LQKFVRSNTWITKTTEGAPGFHLILLNGTWGADLEVKEISLAIDTADGIVLVVGPDRRLRDLPWRRGYSAASAAVPLDAPPRDQVHVRRSMP